MTLEITEVSYDDLSPEEQAEQPNNGSGKKYASYLRVLHNGETIGIFSDAMEPEDARFYRDLDWIKDLVFQAYDLGMSDECTDGAPV